ncbi:type IV pilin [Halobacteriales archaeon SW_5_70_135]|nr:MAG: type IV pilin [Halobacteriales archaeon SW_5_70_135]
MQLRQLLSDDDAVSPVIGVILMVAITVILAAIIGTFVLGIGGQNQQTPQATFGFENDEATSGVKSTHQFLVNVTHSGGDKFDADNTNDLSIETEGTSNDWSLPVSTADEFVLANDSGGSGYVVSPDGTANGLSEGSDVNVVWTAPDGGNGQIISEYTVPS